MFLPDSVSNCIGVLEQAGFETYAVGGCVRDSLLGLTPHDYDLCTGATPEEIAALFAGHTLIRSGEKHGTIGVVVDKQVYEITTFRTEGGYGDSRHPGWVSFVPCVEEDLARRDFTINAIAYHPRKGYIDPFGGREDLEKGILRAVGDPGERFLEDALRILRGVRFGVRFRLTPEEATRQAMFAYAPGMDKLARERVFDELCKLLPLVTARDLLEYAPVLTQVLPELSPCVGFQQHSRHHQYDVYTHIAHVVEAVPVTPVLRWAALLHDVGKPATFRLDEQGKGHFKGHAQLGAQLAEQALLRLKAPTVLREQVVFLVARHMLPLEPDKRLLRRRIGKFGRQAVQDLLALQQADFGGKGVEKEEDPFPELVRLLRELDAEDSCFCVKDLKINGNHLLELGFVPGKEIGECLQYLLELVQDERLPNEQQALLGQAEEYLQDRME